MILPNNVKYTATVIVKKLNNTPIVHHHRLLLSFSVPTACRETGVSKCSNFFTKYILTGVYMILDAQFFQIVGPLLDE